MYFVIYNTTTGELVSQGTVISSSIPAGFTAQDIVNPPTDNTIWNSASRSFVQRAASRIISKYEFIQRYSLAERREMFGFMHGSTYTTAQQKNIASFMRYLDFLDRVDLDDIAIQQGVNYQESISMIGAGRAAQVLA